MVVFVGGYSSTVYPFVSSQVTYLLFLAVSSQVIPNGRSHGTRWYSWVVVSDVCNSQPLFGMQATNQRVTNI